MSQDQRKYLEIPLVETGAGLMLMMSIKPMSRPAGAMDVYWSNRIYLYRSGIDDEPPWHELAALALAHDRQEVER